MKRSWTISDEVSGSRCGCLTVAFVGLVLVAACGEREPVRAYGNGDYGRWIEDRAGLPAYAYMATCGEGSCRWKYNGLAGSGEVKTDLHWFQFGNGRAVALGYNTGAVSMLAGQNLAYMVLNRHRPREGLLGGGIVRILDGERALVSDYVEPGAMGTPVERTFGVGYFRKQTAVGDVELDHIIFAPADRRHALVSLTLARNDSGRDLTFTERWEGRPLVHFPFTPDDAREVRSDQLFDRTEIEATRATFHYLDGQLPAVGVQAVESPEGEFVALADAATVIWTAPLPPGKTTYCIAYGPEAGLDELTSLSDCAALWDQSQQEWAERIPSIEMSQAPWLARELRWAYAFLEQNFPFVEGGYRSGETFHAYAYTIGGSLLEEEEPEPVLARDEFILAVVLSAYDPEFARQLLEGSLVRIPEDPATTWWQIPDVIAASDHPMYVLWALAEYVYASQDWGFLDKQLSYFEGGTGTVWEHALKAYRYHVDRVGLGPTGLIRVMDGDWNDALVTSLRLIEGADEEAVRESAESIMNSAMAAYVMPYAAPLAEAMGDGDLAEELRGWRPAMCAALAKEWNGSWYSRVRLHGTRSDRQGEVIGWDRLYLEPQPWLVISGCSDEHGTTDALLDNIWGMLVAPSDLAAPLLVVPVEHGIGGAPGDGHDGGIWPILNGWLIWAYALHDPQRAWELFQRNSLAQHAEAFPDVWTGIWGGFDSWNAWFSERPGWTWEQEMLYDMNAVPMGYPTPHSAQLEALTRAAGIRFSPEGPVRQSCAIPGRVRIETLVLDVDD